MDSQERIAGSFRDPNGFLFWHQGALFRQIQTQYARHYTRLMESGLYEELVQKNLLVTHEEVRVESGSNHEAWKIIQPQLVSWISYPYEWSFSQLKDAARLTLRIQKLALKYDMWLKDASAYNVQFENGKPIFIDTLSFECLPEGQPWVAYRQFCQHFLAPLALMAYQDNRFQQLLRTNIDGIPLDLASKLLPKRSYLRLGFLFHLHLHARNQKTASNEQAKSTISSKKLTRKDLLNITQSLSDAIQKLEWKPKGTSWVDYYQGDSYDTQGISHKKQLVGDYLQQTNARTMLDLGANTGVFSRIASELGMNTVSADFDAGAVEVNYREVRKNNDPKLLPILLDLTNPSPAIGWANQERDSFIKRFQADGVMALALIHHLAIANNVPLVNVADLFAQLGRWLIIEFVPKSDPKVQTLLASRQDIFPQYTKEGFEEAFSNQFDILQQTPIEHSERHLYLMRKKPQ